jgi:chemotaxis protein MotB|tara:strand:- start:845 stop:1492 length:648 start_codon:yes stop_codon:yes gene_type:complete
MPLAPIRQTGGWKLAYADFLTALCALFLVLWLVHGATPEQKESVAEQFGAAPSLSAMSLVPERHEPARADQLAATLKSSPLFDQNLTYVSLQKLENGVRIELMDLDRAPLFEKGSPLLNPRGKDLIAMTASALSLVDYGVSIEGHTDSDPIHRMGYSNWDLSADRANAARRALLAEGLDPARIRSVAGLADTRPLDDAATSLPQNRRLSIVVHLD